VTVNSVVISDPAFQIDDTRDVVYLDGKPLPEPEYVYILLNKPVRTVTTASDERGRRTVLETVNVRERVFPVGRLDYDTSGVLLLTNDGDLANRLTHPKFEIAKTYRALLDIELDAGRLKKIRQGIDIGEGMHVKPDAIRKSPCKDGMEYIITLHEGRKHEVKRIFRSVGGKVVRLERIAFAGITLKNIPEGEWRYLSEKELADIRRTARAAGNKLPGGKAADTGISSVFMKN